MKNTPAPKSDAKAFVTALRVFQKRHGDKVKTVTALAAIADRPRSAVSDWLSGKRQPSLESIAKVAPRMDAAGIALSL